MTRAVSSWLNSDSNDDQRDWTLIRLISLIFMADSWLDSDSTHLSQSRVKFDSRLMSRTQPCFFDVFVFILRTTELRYIVLQSIKLCCCSILYLLLLLLLVLLGSTCVDRSQRLSVPEVAEGQGRHGPAVPQLRRLGSNVAEKAEAHAGQAGALQEHVLRRVRALAAHQAECRRAPGNAALPAGVRRVSSDTMQIAGCAAPVACAELMDAHRVISTFLDRTRHPVLHDPPE